MSTPVTAVSLAQDDTEKRDNSQVVNNNPHLTLDIPKLQKDTATSGSTADKDNASKKQAPPLHPGQLQPLDSKRKMRNMLIWGTILLVVVVPAVVGPVYYTQVQQPRDREAAEAAARAAIKPPVPPLPPMVPVTTRWYDDFSTLDLDNWSHQLGNGLERGWNFLGYGNSELQCFTSQKANVDIIPDPTNSTSTVLKLQAVYHATAIPCTDQDPYKQATTQWTSGRVRTMSKRIFQAPQTRLPNTTSTENCTSLFIEARMRLPAVKGNRAGLLLLPEPQNQTMGAPRCELTDECGAYGVWPKSGEIDIMEHKDTSTKVSQVIQFQKNGVHDWRAEETDLAEDTLSWHNFKLEWNCDYLRWYIDDERVFGVSRLEVQPWPFDQPFYLAISYAIGGRLVDGNVDQIDSQVLVDYVRAWYGNEEPPTANIIMTASNGAMNQTTGDTTAASGSRTNSSSNGNGTVGN